MPLLLSQTVITQSCCGAINEITCHLGRLFIYAVPGARRRNWSEKSKSSSNVTGAKGVGMAFPPGR